jgi:transitional endoplasmic reticulum ATPase
VAAWPQETKAFMRARLNQYTPPRGLINTVLGNISLLFLWRPWKKGSTSSKTRTSSRTGRCGLRFRAQSNPQEAWNKILEKEVSAKDYRYLLSLLEKELVDVHIPVELHDLFEKVYRAHLRKEYISDASVPKASLLLFVGPIRKRQDLHRTQAIERIIFGNDVLPEVDLHRKKEEVLAGEPFWKTIEEIDPTLAIEIVQRKKLRFYKRLNPGFR